MLTMELLNKLQWFCLILFCINCNGLELKNSCPTYFSYYTLPFGINCYYEPDVFSTTPQILERHVKTFETHELTTSDGYILTMFRIPHENPKGVVVLQHPITTDSVIWVAESNSSLAFLLHEAGFDVWLPNHRGTTYSLKHEILNSDSQVYWDFSYDTIALNDYSVVLNHVYNKTGQKATFITHSMSSAAALVYMSMKSTEAKSLIKLNINLAPTVYYKYGWSPLKLVCKIYKILQIIDNALGIYEFCNPGTLVPILFHTSVYLPFKRTYMFLNHLLFGNSGDQFDLNLVNLLASLNPNSMSKKLLYHFCQNCNTGTFSQYDYGKTKNFEVYNSENPPDFPLGKIETPLFFIASNMDSVATQNDTNTIISQIPQNSVKGKHFFDGFNHVDFHYGKQREELLYGVILGLLKP